MSEMTETMPMPEPMPKFHQGDTVQVLDGPNRAKCWVGQSATITKRTLIEGVQHYTLWLKREDGKYVPVCLPEDSLERAHGRYPSPLPEWTLVRIPKGTVITAGLEQRIAKKSYVVRIHWSIAGYEAEDGVIAQDAEVTWAGAGAYWQSAKLEDVEVFP